MQSLDFQQMCQFECVFCAFEIGRIGLSLGVFAEFDIRRAMEKHIIRTLFYDFVNGEVLDIAADDFDLAEHFLCQFGSSVECTLFLDNLFYALLCCLTASASADCNNLNVVPAAKCRSHKRRSHQSGDSCQ